ncbi:MAG: PIN domain-containing protein [Bifidobacteriaceae bacterium]|jgi:predicted nucleic acid-binding protein|nr:PIN domain-containing protein [Bifidobacteriaceae bacterium]
MRLVVDTSGVLAALDAAAPAHQAFHEALTGAAAAAITPITVAEVHYLLTSRRAYQTANDFLEDIASGFYDLMSPTAKDYARAAALIAQYSGQIRRKKAKAGSIDLADAMNVIAAARVQTNCVLTADADYRLVRPLSAHAAFTLVPVDLGG